MDWFNILNKKKDYLNQEVVLGIVFREEKGELLLVKKNLDKFRLIEKQFFYYSNAFENLPEDIDQILSYFEEKGYREIERVVYFLSGFFFNEKRQVKDLFLNKLKEINEKLEFEALGYIEIAEALIYQKEKENGLPLSAIFIEIEKTQFRFILKKAGKKVYEKVQPKTDNFLFDIYEIIYDIKEYYPLPIRIIIFDGDNLAKEKESLSNHLFKEEYFIQTPRVEIVTQETIEKYFIDCLQSELFKEFTAEKNLIQKEKATEILGFLIDQDIKEINENLSSSTNYQGEIESSNLKNSLFESKDNFIKAFLTRVKHWSILLFGKIPKSIFFFKNSQRKFLFFAVLFILGLSTFINEVFFHKVVIKLTLPRKEFKKEISINETENKLISDRIEKLIEKKVATTGKKDVGEKAQGEIEIYNYTFEKKILNSGTILDAKGIEYFLKDQVAIASASYIGNQIGNPIQPGKSKGLIIASKIGEEGNQPEGTVFLVKNFSQNEIFAKSSQSITGGYKKEINVFSQSDKEKLQQLVINEGKKTAGDKDRANLILIPPLTEVKLIDENYSKEVGDESQEVALKAKITVDRYFFDKNKIKDVFLRLVEKDTPQGYVIDEKSIRPFFNKINEKDNLKIFSFVFQGSMIKKIDKEKIRKELAFINKNSLKDRLKSYHIVNYEIIKEKNLIPFFYNYFPFFSKNIEIIID